MPKQANLRLLEVCAVLIPHIENALALLSKFINVNPVHINRWVENCNVNLSTLNKVLLWAKTKVNFVTRSQMRQIWWLWNDMR